MRFRPFAVFSEAGRAASFLKIYVISGVLVLLVGFVLYSQWILGRLEMSNRALVEPLARLSSYYPSIEDRETSQLVQEVVNGVTADGRIQFVITDSRGAPLLSRGVGEQIDQKLRDDVPLTEPESLRVREVIGRMTRADREPIQIEYLSRDRRIIGRVYYGDVDPSMLAEIPLVLTDIHDEPVAWRIYADWQTPASHPEMVRRALLFVREAQHRKRSRVLQISPSNQTGEFHYSVRPMAALQWMPILQIALVGGFVAGGMMLYSRLRADEQAAIWAGLAKESAHQLGTPLTSLFGWVDVARSIHPVGPDAAVPELYEEMHRDLGRLERVVTRFAQVGRAPTMSSVDVNRTVAEASSYFRERLPSRETRVVIEETYGSVPSVQANEDLLLWVVENLIRNAMDAIEDGGDSHGVIGLLTNYDRASNYVTISVRDNGSGMARGVRRRVFTAGFSTKKRGWGVGLALARRIVESYHHGVIRVAETSSSGTTLEVRLRGEQV